MSLFNHIVSDLNIAIYDLQGACKTVTIDYTETLFKLNDRVTMLNVTDKEITLFPSSIIHVVKEKELPVADVLKTLKDVIKYQSSLTK